MVKRMSDPTIQGEKKGWVWVLGVIAVIYNPFVHIHLTREIWSIVNIVTILIAAASIFVLKPDRAVKEDS